MPTKEDIYFITKISRREVDFPSFPEVPVGYAVGSQLVYSQRYISTDILSPSDFQVFGGQLRIGAFGSQEVSTISHNTSERKHINFSLLYYVYYLVQEQ